MILGYDRGSLWGLPDDGFTVEKRPFLPDSVLFRFKIKGREIMMPRNSRLLEGGHTCMFWIEGSTISHVIDQETDNAYTIHSPSDKPQSGTIALKHGWTTPGT